MAHLLIRDTVLSDRRLPLPGRVVVLGRSLDADVPLPHRSVSRRHALIEQSISGWTLSDLGSSNGTFLGERRLASGERVTLGMDMPFKLGEVVLRLVEDEAIETPEPAISQRAKNGSGARIDVFATANQAVPPPASARPREPRGPSSEWRDRSGSSRWLAIVLTIVFLAIAAFFISRIVSNMREEAARKRTGSKKVGDVLRDGLPGSAHSFAGGSSRVI